jgi:hypothetical protein
LTMIILDVNGFWNKKITQNGKEVAEYQTNSLNLKNKKFDIKFNGIVLAEGANMADEKGVVVCSAQVEKAKDGFWPFKKEYFVVMLKDRKLISESFVIPPKEEIVLKEDNKSGLELSIKLFSYPLVGTISFNNKLISESEALEVAFTLYALTAERYVN